MKKVTAFLITIAIMVFAGPAYGLGEITDPAFKQACGEVIRAFGYQCPRAAVVWHKGIKPHGIEIKVICGPPQAGKVYPALSYRLYMDPQTGQLTHLAPW